MSGLLASLEENRLWIVLGFGAIASIILAIYVIKTSTKKKAKAKKAKARQTKRKGAAGAPANVDSNGMPLDDDDDGEFRDVENDDMEGDGESVYKDWD